MARPPSPDVRITEALQPAAAVVNIGFSHPAAPAPSSLHGVAQALESLSGDLMAWGRKEEERRKEEDQIRGEAAFYPRGSVKIPRVWSLETPPLDNRGQRR